MEARGDASEYVRVGRVDEFPHGVIRAFDHDGLDVAVASYREHFYAFSNHCAHLGYPLDDSGWVSPDLQIICTSHDSTYDLSSGHLVDGPGFSGLPIYDVRVEDGEVLVARKPNGA
jgi:nitrite reductase/ring-hydroxylating ferredoxin subunit